MYFTMTFSFAMRMRVLLAAAFVLPPIVSGSAQVVGRQQLETRATLIERAAREERAGHRGQAASIRARLAEGDYQEGDRVVVQLENLPSEPGRTDLNNKADTLPVRAVRVLQFPQPKYEGVKDLQIGGLLRSELPDTIRKHLATIFRNPVVRVTSLIALSVTGAVNRIGIVDVPPDMRLNDVFTIAGGLSGTADLRKITVLRGAQEIMSGKDVQNALNASVTVDGAQLRAGDVINVPTKTTTNWLGYAGFAMSIVSLVIFLSRD